MAPNSNNGEAGRTALASPRTPSNYADISESMRQLRNQTPEESLGLTGHSSLLGPCLLATVIAVVAVGLLTAIPYFLSRSNDAPAKVSQPAAETPENPNPPTPGPTPSEVGKTPSTTTTGPAKSPNPKSKDLVDILGENGTKKANPKVNPLDKKDDDLLKEIK